MSREPQKIEPRTAPARPHTRRQRNEQRTRYGEPQIEYEIPLKFRAIQFLFGMGCMLLSYGLAKYFGEDIYLTGFFILSFLCSLASLMGKAVFVRDDNKNFIAFTGILAAIAGIATITSAKFTTICKALQLCDSLLNYSYTVIS